MPCRLNGVVLVTLALNFSFARRECSLGNKSCLKSLPYSGFYFYHTLMKFIGENCAVHTDKWKCLSTAYFIAAKHKYLKKGPVVQGCCASKIQGAL